MDWYITMFVSLAYLWIFGGLTLAVLFMPSKDWEHRLIRIVGWLAVIGTLFYYSNKGDPHLPNKIPNTTLRVGFLNANIHDNRINTKAMFALENDIDIVGYVEAREDWFKLMAPDIRNITQRAYPYISMTPLNYPTELPYRMILQSKYPFRKIGTLGEQATAYKVFLPNQDINIVLVHAWAPVSQFMHHGRNNFLSSLARVDLGPEPVIIMGDFNTVPWTRIFRTVKKGQQLQHAGTLWPSYPKGHSWVPIDHVLVSKNTYDYGTFRKKVGHTDHLGVISDLKMPLRK